MTTDRINYVSRPKHELVIYRVFQGKSAILQENIS
jgi:hypothetical protein